MSLWRPRVFAPAVRHLVEESKKSRQDDAVEFPVVTPHDLRHTAASLAIISGATVKAVQTMLGHASAVLTLDTYADLFPDDLEMVSAALDEARRGALECARDSAADQLWTGTEQDPDHDFRSGPATCDDASRGGGIRTHDLFVPNADSMYQDWSASAIELHRCDRQ